MTAQLVAYIVAVLGANALVLLHAFLIPWRRNAEGFGRHLFIFHLVIALFLNHGVVQLIFPDYTGRQTVRLVLYVVGAWVMWWRVVIVFRVQVMPVLARRKQQDQEPSGAKG